MKLAAAGLLLLGLVLVASSFLVMTTGGCRPHMEPCRMNVMDFAGIVGIGLIVLAGITWILRPRPR